VNRSLCLHVVVVVAATVLLSAVARAQPERPNDRRRVLLLVESSGDPFMGRIRAEIASLGLDVVVRAPQGAIEANARAEHAVAAIRMLPSRNGVEVWMADETSGRSLLRQAIVDETPGGPNQNLIALQTAELLRTSFFPHEPSAAVNPALPGPVVIQAAPAAAPSGDSGLASSVGLLYSAGGASPAWQAWLSLQHLWNHRSGVGLHLGVPVRRGTMNGPEGTAHVGAFVAGAEALGRFELERAGFFLTTALGAAFVSVRAEGHPSQAVSAQLASNSSTAYTGLGYARVALGWRPTSWFGLGLDGLAGTTVARVHVRFAGNDEGDWGVPVLGASLFAEVDWR